MKLKLVLSAITIFSVLSVAFIPSAILSSVSRVNTAPVREELSQNIVYCSGEIVEKRVKEVYLETPVIAREVFVEVGQWVQKGQTLAVINTDLTQTVLSQGATASSLDEPLPTEQELRSIAEQYGISEDLIQSAVRQQGTQSTEGFIPREITAPMDGIVTAVNIQTDVLTQTARPVLTVSDNSSYAAKVSVNENDVALIKVGDQAMISGSGFAGRQYSGSVTKIYPTARKTLNGTIQQTVVDVEITIDQPDESLKPGFSAKAAVQIGEEELSLTVPYEAVLQDSDNREYVYVYRANRVEKLFIETGREMAESVQVISGLTGDSAVVINPEEIKNPDGLAYTVKGQGGTDS